MKNNFISNISIKYKLTLSFFLLSLIPFIAIQYIYYYTSSNILKDKSIKYSQDVLKMLELRLDVFSSQIIKNSEALLYEPRIHNLLAVSSIDVFDPNFKMNVDYMKAHREAMELFRDSTFSNPEILSACIIASNKNIYAYNSNSSRVDISKLIDYDKMSEVSRNADGKPVWYFTEGNGIVQDIFLLRTIKDKNNLQELCMIAILINKEELNSIFKSIDFQMMKHIEIISSANQIITTNIKESENFITEPFEKLSKENGYYIDEKNKYLISYINLKSTQWKVLTYISLEDLYIEINSLRATVTIICIITVLIAFIVSLILSLDILKPINQLVTGMKRFLLNGDNIQIDIFRNDELGYMGQTFNEMTKRINHLVNGIYAEQLTRKEAELKSLQAQINPHFLFNTLESINWMAQLNGVPEISETVSALSTLMEINICRNDKLIFLREEMRYIDNYIYIMKKRYEERLIVEKLVDEDILDFKIPVLLIQPLIENSIYHGVEKSSKSIKILIHIYKISDSCISLEVIDNGAGIEENELRKLNDKFKSANSILELNGKTRKGIGLENVNRRIKLFYGDEYGLTIESFPNEYTKVKTSLPKYTKECSFLI